VHEFAKNFPSGHEGTANQVCICRPALGSSFCSPAPVRTSAMVCMQDLSFDSCTQRFRVTSAAQHANLKKAAVAAGAVVVGVLAGGEIAPGPERWSESFCNTLSGGGPDNSTVCVHMIFTCASQVISKGPWGGWSIAWGENLPGATAVDRKFLRKR